MTTRREATCSCGQLRLWAEGDPLRVSVCHCLACQRRSGSAFAAQARFDEDRITTEGASASYLRVADSGNRVTFSFCPRCGATVFYRLEAMPGFVAVPLGAFADPAFPPPTVSIYEARQHPWLTLAAVEHLE